MGTGTTSAAPAVQRVSLQRELRESRRQLAVAFDSAPIGMAVTTDSGLLVRANAALTELLGVPVQALPGRRLDDLTPPSVAAELSAAREQLVNTAATRQVTRGELHAADGQHISGRVHLCARTGR